MLGALKCATSSNSGISSTEQIAQEMRPFGDMRRSGALRYANGNEAIFKWLREGPDGAAAIVANSREERA
jgi:hypothetical protein